MIRILFFVICLKFQFLDASNPVKLKCTYENVVYENNTYYRCENKNTLNLISKKRNLIEKHSGTHEDGMTDDDVVDFYSDNKNIQYFPQGLTKHFKNLNRIIINSNGLKDLTQSDLKYYPNLKTLILDNNLIEVLHDDLFLYNPDLNWISFENNFIIQIFPKAFNGLNKLHTLDLTSNFCINRKVENDSTAVKNFIDEVIVKCSNSEFLEIDGELKKLEENIRNLNYSNALEMNTKYQKLYFKLDHYDITDSNHLNIRMRDVQSYIDIALSEFYQVLFQKIENLEKRLGN